MSEPARKWISVEEYLAFEARAEGKHEYFHGQIFDMAGGSPEHNLIAGNVLRELSIQLDAEPCLVFPSDQRLKIASTGLYTYPDVTVQCGEPEYEDTRPRSLLNPLLIVEVLSESTEAYDRGAKFEHYRTLPSLREYVLVASNRRCVERFTRQPDSDDWVLAACTDPEGALALPSIGCRLELARVYHKVELPAPTLRLRTEPE